LELAKDLIYRDKGVDFEWASFLQNEANLSGATGRHSATDIIAKRSQIILQKGLTCRSKNDRRF